MAEGVLGLLPDPLQPARLTSYDTSPGAVKQALTIWMHAASGHAQVSQSGTQRPLCAK
jgi:hypothetical protein